MAMKLTKLQKEYRKERNRIRNFLRKLENRGYLDTESVLPDQPKKITRGSVNRLKKLTSEEIYRKVKYLDSETGEVTSGVRGRDIERSRSAKKAAETRRQKKKAEEEFWTGGGAPIDNDGIADGGQVIYDNIVNGILLRLSQPIEDEAYTFYYGKKKRRNRLIVELAEKRRKELLAIIESYVRKDGKSAIGWRLQENSDEIDMLLSGLLYSSTQETVEFSFSRLVEIIKGSGLTTIENETINSVAETMEDWSSYE